MTDLLGSSRATPTTLPGGLPVRRPPSRVSRRALVLWCVGALLAVLGAVSAVGLSRSTDARARVLVVAHSLPAGARLTASDVTVASVAADRAVALMPASQQALVVGQYLRVRLLAGQLLAADFVQAGPLVTAGRVVVALPVTAVQVPWGMHEQSRVELVVTPAGGSGGTNAPAPFTTEGVVVRYPQFGNDTAATAALSVEVDPTAAPALVAAGRNVAVVLLDATAGARG